MITMSDQYSRGILKMVIAQICQMIGWHSINSTPLEFLVDLMQEYLLRVSKVTHQYSEILGRTEANLDDLGLAFRHMHVLIPELSEYVRNVDSVPCIVSIPKFPVCRDNHLNFLKPGSQEVVTRPVHVHEHLPAMFPNTEESCLIEKDSSPTNCPTDSVGGGGGGGGGGGSGGGAGGGGGGGGGSGGSGGGSGALPEASLSPTESSPQSVFKRPGGLLEHSTLAKRSKIIEEGRPLREIHSVIMTTSGFLSPAREGKLPEPRTPHPARADSPPSSSYPMVPPELKTEKKVKKIVKKGVDDRKLDKENKKKNRVKELFKPDNITEIKGKKVGSNAMKEVAKIKPPKCSGSKGHLGSPGSSSSKSAGSVAATAGIAATATAASTATDTPQLMAHKEVVAPKTPKSSQSRVKNDRLPEVVTSIVGVSQQKEETVDKLPSEPDKQKLNIFKKISKPREEKNAEGPEAPLRCKELDSRESSPGLIIDEITDKHGQRSDKDSKREEKKTPRTPEVHIIEGSGAGGGGEPTDIQSPTPDVYIFDDMSPPGTPSTPKTPELSVPVPVDLKTNKKKKDRNIRKKEQRSKSPKPSIKPKKVNCQYRSSEFQLKAQSGSGGGGGGGDEPLCERPKTPQAVEAEQPHKEPSNSTTPALPFPFFPPFPSAPGLIPHPIGHPMFPRYPLPLGRGVPGAHPAMPNLPMPPRFLTSNIRADDCLPPKVHPMEREKSLNTTCEEILEPDRIFDKFQKPIVEKVVKSMKLEKEITQQQQQQQQQQPPATVPCILSQNESLPPTTVFLNSTPTAAPTTVSRLITKNDKLDKNIKKSKDHKKERKDKLKKKKDKKEKHKIKDKSKGKKGKLTKLKDKKEKKDKRKEKEKDEKSAEAVPKITLKLGPASPRPPTPDNTTMKKITIKPLIKKPDEEKKREPSPELAKIAALVTRPPKQKITKLKADAIPKKSDGIDEKENGKDVTSSQPINVEQASSQVWICPACGNQDDGSPMIGCDDCDAWYHWVCVGVQVPPADHENWYCPLCITKKQELHNDKKKKKRKKKVKPVS